MCRKSASLWLTTLVAAMLAPAGAALAQCQIPLIIGSSGSTANVLLLIDNSGSMNEPIYHDNYNINTTYSGNFTTSTVYNISVTGTYSPKSFKSTWASTPTATLVKSDGGQAAQYSGNYLNWIFYHASATDRAAIPTLTKIQGAKQVVNNVLTTVTGARFAIETFNGDAGGTIISPFGTSIASMQTAVNGLVANSWTPLAESAITAMNYYQQTGVNAPIQSSCQQSFVIIVTDGLPTQDLNVPSYIGDCDNSHQAHPSNCTAMGTGYPNSDNCSNWLPEVTCYMYRNDMRADLTGIQNIGTFTIGFAIDTPFLQKAADNGGGEYYSVHNTAGLNAALAQAFNTIAKRVAAGASVSVVSSEDRTNNRLFRARYESQTWKGYVEAYALPFHAGTSPQWESGSILSTRAPDSRRIFTSTNGTSLSDFTRVNKATLKPLLGAPDTTTARNIIDYIRGTPVTGYRDRGGWVLGDIVDAAPVAVGKPNNFLSINNYAAFRSQWAGRQEVLYVAANDGMLHCFSAADGSELWGYVPKGQLPRLVDLTASTYCHEYFVNMTPGVYDIFMNSAWHTVLVGGEERGGNGLFALDVTTPNPDTLSLLWNVNLPQLHGSWNCPTLVRDKTLNRQVLAVGTGYNAAAATESLLVIDPTNGSVLSGRALGAVAAGGKTTKASSIDTDFDGFDDVMYLGDLAGNLWRVNEKTNPWSVSLLYNCGKPIQGTPVATVKPNGQEMVFFGTGQFLVGTDPSTTTTQSIYGLIDDNSGNTISSSNLADQSTSIHAVGSKGWFMNLAQASGERVTRSAALVNGTLYVPSFQPNTSSCSGGAQSWLYTLDYKDGSAPDNYNGTANNVTTGRAQSMGDGFLADPTVDMVNEAVLLQSSNAVVITYQMTGEIRKLIVHSWRQKWN
jgi:type IV pilus assembly protein PilY1